MWVLSLVHLVPGCKRHQEEQPRYNHIIFVLSVFLSYDMFGPIILQILPILLFDKNYIFSYTFSTFSMLNISG